MLGEMLCGLLIDTVPKITGHSGDDWSTCQDSIESPELGSSRLGFVVDLFMQILDLCDNKNRILIYFPLYQAFKDVSWVF